MITHASCIQAEYCPLSHGASYITPWYVSTSQGLSLAPRAVRDSVTFNLQPQEVVIIYPDTVITV